MTAPWATPTADRPSYATIALAEAAIIAAGYVRDRNRHVWVNGQRTSKVIRENNVFYVEWA